MEMKPAIPPDHTDQEAAAPLLTPNTPTSNDLNEAPVTPQRESVAIDYRRMLENSGDGYFEVDLSGNFTRINDAACRFIGRTREESIGLNYRDYMRPDEAQRILHIYQEVYQTGQPSELMEYNIIRKDGTIATHQTVVTLLRDVSGNPLGFCGIVRDLTRQKAMERALRESEESYQRVLELAPDAIAINDARTSKYIQVNTAFCQHTGYRPEEIIGRTPIELNLYLDPGDDQRIKRLLINEGKIDGLELRYQKKSGEQFEDLVSARMIRFKGKTCSLFVATGITPLKQAQKALCESEKRYREILEAAPDAICLTTLSDGRYVEANSEFYRRTGYTPSETIGFTSTDLNLYVNPGDRQLFIDTLQSKGQVDAFELPVRYKDGTISEQLWSARIIEHGGQQCLLVIARPIDDIKAAQRAVVESEESYRRIMELAPDMIVITRQADGRIVAANDAFCARTGFSRNELIGHTPIELGFYTDPDNRRRWMEALRRDGKVQGIELQFINRAGKVHDDLFSAQYIRFKGEDCVLAVITSITQLKNNQRELEHYRRDLEQIIAERTKALEAAQAELVKREKLAVLGQLTATVSHELRNPLGVIRSSNYYLQSKNRDKSQKSEKHFRRIDEQVTLCDTIVAELLEYTRGRSIWVAKQPMAPWMTEVVEQLQETKGVDIALTIPDDLPDLHHDREKMRRVLINVLDNAVQAVQEKMKEMQKRTEWYRPAISVRTETVDNEVTICITDNGIGMNEETRRRAFEPLFTTRARGTGIGLANVKKIVEEHGGRIVLTSRTDQGTEMKIVLPCVRET
ncbi:PAS domain-containing protein [Desulfatitalea tepidiphila]|uniref:PAS domain-containing protein n=1 Tax=Desulfatitalea tepidiphila TaxID=1185843 RepID=UPI0006B65133|nr:PAS domain S-box protein [Desulfatitalea tepidiphila]